jgi:hypothetical protein
VVHDTKPHFRAHRDQERLEHWIVSTTPLPSQTASPPRAAAVRPPDRAPEHRESRHPLATSRHRDHPAAARPRAGEEPGNEPACRLDLSILRRLRIDREIKRSSERKIIHRGPRESQRHRIVWGREAERFVGIVSNDGVTVTANAHVVGTDPSAVVALYFDDWAQLECHDLGTVASGNTLRCYEQPVAFDGLDTSCAAPASMS